jgi:glucitol operon activator protein
VPLWQIALIALVVMWALQAVGTWSQMRHYREVLGGASKSWADGYLGAGNARATFGRGVILVLVVGPDALVRRLFVMEGRSVFARFQALEAFEGLNLAALHRDDLFSDVSPRLARARKTALDQALHQIERARARSLDTAPPLASATFT